MNREGQIAAAIDALNGILPAASCFKDPLGNELVRFSSGVVAEIREIASRVVDALA